MTTPSRPASGLRWTSRILCTLGLVALAACGKSDRPPTTTERLAAVQEKQATQPDFFVPRKTVDYMADLKSIKDAPPKAESVPAKAETPKPPEPKGARVQAAETKPVSAAASTPPPVAAPSPAVPSANVVASAVPSARPAPPSRDVTPVVSVVAREQPEFPREAMRAGIDTGNVRAKLSINAAGDVTEVTILQAQPPRVFDRSVKQALQRWKFNAGADGRSYETDVGFKATN